MGNGKCGEARSPRIRAKLRELDERCGRKRIARQMKQEGWLFPTPVGPMKITF
jgi:hypothetical protein